MTTAAVIVAAGLGRRLGGDLPKQYRMLGGQAILARTIRGALASEAVDLVLVAIHPDFRAEYDRAVASIADPRLLPPATGGAERADTVRLALAALADHAPSAVLVHDAARPFASPALWSRLAAHAVRGRAAIAALRVVDALWEEEDGFARTPRPRRNLWRAQTPQAFPYRQLCAAHEAASGPPALDDAELFVRAGHQVRLVEGETRNFKITTATDLARAEAVVAREAPMDIRVGHGFDVHAFRPGDHVMLCGVRVPHDRGLAGHSDADVGLHALADAIYGALAEGDIGTHFPPSDPRWKGAESHIFLSHAADRVAARGGRIGNVDVTLLCERPRIGPHAAAMRDRVAQILRIGPDRVGLKATTMEKMGFMGREDGMGCIATATVVLGGAP